VYVFLGPLSFSLLTIPPKVDGGKSRLAFFFPRSLYAPATSFYLSWLRSGRELPTGLILSILTDPCAHRPSLRCWASSVPKVNRTTVRNRFVPPNSFRPFWPFQASFPCFSTPDGLAFILDFKFLLIMFPGLTILSSSFSALFRLSVAPRQGLKTPPSMNLSGRL